MSRLPSIMLAIFIILKYVTLALGTRNISGPTSLNDRIAIVGAGPSGIHMAYKLIEAGFKQITVFESSDYIGGMSRTIYHRRIPHDMGAYNIHSGYDELQKLIAEFDSGVPVPGPEPNLWVDRKSGSRRKFIMSKYQYCSAVADQLKPGINESEIFTSIFAALTSYKILHEQLFGLYNGSLMPRPSKKVLVSLNMTFLEFLKLHDIEILKCVLGMGMTAQGYGQLDKVSAIYGLIYMHPSYMAQLVLNPEPSFNQILSKGNQFIWQEIVRQLDIDVRLSSPVKRIVREFRPRKRFDVTYSHCSGLKTEKFDFLILSPTMNSLIKTVNFNKKEKRLFGKTTHGYITTSLVDTTYGKRRSSSPHNYHIDNILSNVDNKVILQRDSYSSMTQLKGENYTAGMYPGGLDGIKEHSTVYYQLVTGSKPGRQILERSLRKHINIVEKAKVSQIKEQIIWSYFPRYSVQDMAKGVLWDILNMQGKYGIWYIGSSVSFESINSVLEYNKLIFQLYTVPNL